MNRYGILVGAAVLSAAFAATTMGADAREWQGSPLPMLLAAAALAAGIAVMRAYTWELRVRRRHPRPGETPGHGFAFRRDDTHRCSLTGCVTAHE